MSAPAIGKEVWVVSDCVTGAQCGRITGVHETVAGSGRPVPSWTVELPGRAPARVWELFFTAEAALRAALETVRVQMDLLKRHLKEGGSK